MGKATVFVGESESELLTNSGGPLVDEEDDLPRFLYDFFRRVALLLLLRYLSASVVECSVVCERVRARSAAPLVLSGPLGDPRPVSRVLFPVGEEARRLASPPTTGPARDADSVLAGPRVSQRRAPPPPWSEEEAGTELIRLMLSVASVNVASDCSSNSAHGSIKCPDGDSTPWYSVAPDPGLISTPPGPQK